MYRHALFLSGRLPCCICNQHRARYVLLLSCRSSCSFNLSGLAQLTVQTQQHLQNSGQMHKEWTVFLTLWVGERRTFPCRFLAPPSRCLLGHFQKQTIDRLGIGLVHHATAFCGAGCVREYSVGDIHWSDFLSQQKVELLSMWKSRLLSHMTTEQRLKTILVPTEIAPGPKQNKADILNWREPYVLFIRALPLPLLAEWTVHPL